jgi:poly-gamma-glutamate synthesis protein (capsule biosynthesis protein)
MVFVVSAVGDIVVTRPLGRSLDKPGVAAIARALRTVDHAVGNLEIPLCGGGRKQEKLIAHYASPASAPHLARMGLGSLVLANNHAMDLGPEGLLETISHLRQVGITPIGAGRNLQEAFQPLYLGNEDVNIAVIALSALLPLGAAAAEDRPGIAPIRVETSYQIDANHLLEQPGTPPIVHTTISEDDFTHIAQIVEGCRERADYVVVFVHWGVGLQQAYTDYQVDLGHRLIEAGTDIVVGGHPHLVQGIDKHGKGYVFYSLGEFFSQFPKEGFPPEILELLSRVQPEGYILRLAFARGRPIGIEVVPLRIDEDGDPTLDGTRDVLAKISSLCRVGYQIKDGTLHLVD